MIKCCCGQRLHRLLKPIVGTVFAQISLFRVKFNLIALLCNMAALGVSECSNGAITFNPNGEDETGGGERNLTSKLVAFKFARQLSSQWGPGVANKAEDTNKTEATIRADC